MSMGLEHCACEFFRYGEFGKFSEMNVDIGLKDLKYTVICNWVYAARTHLKKTKTDTCCLKLLLLWLSRCDASSPYIHPVGYCEEAELTLTTPAGKTQTKTNVGQYKLF